ncbi:MAG TPA: hypothetical protein PKW80_13350 [Bacteroidales bacterium]|nr:hypothetical protein [Bacteroidales bacterium]
MNKYTDKEIKIKLKSVFWDHNITSEDLFGIFTGKKKNVGSVNRVIIYYRLLNSYDWYTLLKMVPSGKWKEMLSDPVLENLFPKSLKKKYSYARRVLYG